MKKTTLFYLGVLIILYQSCDLYPDEYRKGEKIGNSYYYYGGWGYSEISDSARGIIIERDIVAWNNDSVFIIAKQKPYLYITDSIKKINPETNYSIMKRLYNQSQLYYYWIIDTREEEVYYIDYDIKAKIVLSSGVKGPLNYKEYWEKRLELGVPDTLRLKYIEKHFMVRLNNFISYGTPLKPRRDEILE